MEERTASRYRVVMGRQNGEKRTRAKQFRQEMTEAEDLLWQRLRGSQLHGLHFRRQHVIDGFIVDFYCHSAGLIVEVDGGVHEQQQGADAARTAILQTRQLRVLRFTNEQVLNDMASVHKGIAVAAGSNTQS